MPNLVFLHPSFMFSGEPYSMPTPATGYSAANVITGSRQLRYKHGSSTTTLTFKTSVKTLYGDERQAQYIYVAGMKLMNATQNVDIEVKGADDSAISTNVSTETLSGIAKTALVGAASDDYVSALAGNYRDYWQVKFTVAAAQAHELRKLYIGQYFYFGQEPDTPATIGTKIGDGRRQLRTFDLSWSGVTDDAFNLFNRRIMQYRHFNPIVLWAQSWGGVIDGETVVHCMIDDMQIEFKKNGYRNVKLRFLEII